VSYSYLDLFFFFQAEDGIRDLYVTGVQTCALPILPFSYTSNLYNSAVTLPRMPRSSLIASTVLARTSFHAALRKLNWEGSNCQRSEERRVGKECRSAWSAAYS